MRLGSILIRGTIMDGAGNKFCVIDGLNRQALPEHLRVSLVKTLCQQTESLAVDGVVFLEPPKALECDFSWDFYNSDGSRAEFCGNAARCVSVYFRDRVLRKEAFSFMTLAGQVFADQVTSESARVLLPNSVPPPALRPARDLSSELMAHFAVVGVPHLVIEGEASVTLGADLRRPTAERPNGANVTFVRRHNSGLSAVTYERGVEGFTKACGSGALAAGLYFHQIQGEAWPIVVRFPGGLLKIDFAAESGLYLSGPVRYHFDFKMEIPCQ